jgi:hypothetical protein
VGAAALRASAEGLFSPSVARRLQDVNVSLVSDGSSAKGGRATAATLEGEDDDEDAEARALLEEIRRLASQIDPEDF